MLIKRQEGGGTGCSGYIYMFKLLIEVLDRPSLPCHTLPCHRLLAYFASRWWSKSLRKEMMTSTSWYVVCGWVGVTYRKLNQLFDREDKIKRIGPSREDFNQINRWSIWGPLFVRYEDRERAKNYFKEYTLCWFCQKSKSIFHPHSLLPHLPALIERGVSIINFSTSTFEVLFLGAQLFQFHFSLPGSGMRRLGLIKYGFKGTRAAIAISDVWLLLAWSLQVWRLFHWRDTFVILFFNAIIPFWAEKKDIHAAS